MFVGRSFLMDVVTGEQDSGGKMQSLEEIRYSRKS